MDSEKQFSFRNITVFPMGKIISGLRLKEGKNMPVMTVCDKYEAALKGGQHAFQLCEQFTADLANVANTDITRNVVKRCNKILKENERDLANMKAVQSLYESNLSYIAKNIEQKMSVYLSDKSVQNRNELHEAVSVFAGNSAINSILENLSYDEYETKHNKELHNLKTVSDKKKVYTEEEVNALINEKMKKIEENTVQKPVVGRPTSFKEINTHIELDKTIKNILEHCGVNKKLADFCMSYYNELNKGVTEESLLESFISGISNWNFMPAVDTQISALRARTEKYKQEIDLKRILEYMSQTGSYYIVPLIEECVLDYMNNKSLANKAILKQRLVPFEFDPFVRDIENILLFDLSIPNTVYLGESVEKMNGYVHTDLVYSPVLYIKENESVFNVKGMYYVKKGNTISRLPKKDISALPESFSRICSYLSMPNVQVINETNEIKVYDGKDCAVISEGAIKVNGKKITSVELKGLCEHFNTMAAGKNAFYNAVRELNENFDNVAYIDFVKHVALNEDDNHYVDVFRIKNNIFVTTVDKVNGVSTFYKNVNPIQCRKYINEHMGMNIGSIFEDILPSQETVKKMIMEKRAMYEGYIEELQTREQELNDLKSESGTDTDVIEDALSIIHDELEKAQADYKDYTQDTDDYLNGKSDDAETTHDDGIDDLTGNEPTESPEEMSTPLEDEPSMDTEIMPSDDNITVDTPTPELDTTGISDFDGLLDTPATNDAEGNEVTENSYKIVDVRYNYNVKADKTENKGELIVIIPTVDMNGDIHNDMKRITFYLDENGKPVLNNEYMPLDMYMAIISAINSNPKTAEIISDIKNGNITHRSVEPVESNIPSTIDNNASEPVQAETPKQSVVEPNDADIKPVNVDIMGEFGDDDFDALLATLSDEDEKEMSETPDTNSSEDKSDNNPENKAEDFSNSTPVEQVKQESPEEQRKDAEEPSYPIDVPLNMDDINPISKEDFEEDLDKAGIKHSQSEANSQEICFTITDKSQVKWLKNYFKEWKGYGEYEFNNFFPELKNCMNNNGSVPIMKLESIILPYNEDYCKLFSIKNSDSNASAIKLVFESEADRTFAYNALKRYSKTHVIDEDAKLFIDRYETEKLNESSLIKVPYSNFLHRKLLAMDFSVQPIGESLYITVDGLNAKKAKAIFESFYKEEMPTSVSDFIKDSHLNENVKITIEADGKTVTIDTDDLTKKAKKENTSDENPDDEFDPDKSFEAVTTFDDKTMNPYGNEPDDEDADDEDEDKKKKDGEKEESKPLKDDENLTKDEKSKEDEEDKEKESEEKPKKSKGKKIVIKKNESLVEPDFIDQMLTESAKPTVMDNVKLSDGRRGQIIYQMANGDFIVNVAGRTVECAQSSVSMLVERPDTVDVPYKFDPNTLKGLFEQYVKCGMFMNGMRMTPDDCKMKYSDYVAANNEDKVPVLVENQKLMIDRKYMRILEDVNTFANVAEYEKLGDKYFYNKKDFSLAESANNMNALVRVIANTGEKWELISLPAGTLKS